MDQAEQRITAIKLYQGGTPQTRIAEALRVSQSTIHNWVKRAGLTKTRKGHYVNRNTRDAVTEHFDPSDLDENRYRIVDPTVAELAKLKPFPRLKLTSWR